MKKLLIVLTMSWVSSSFADQTALNNFMNNAKTMKADFTQTVVSGKKSRTTTGTMEISRPNKFRWEYTKEQQLIVSDAKKIYIYDKPLQQVTEQKLGNSIDRSPAAVLAGANNLTKIYKVSEIATHEDGLNWIKIEPNSSNENNGFQTVIMGFDNTGKLSAMKFIDSFGNQTNLKFSNLQTGIHIPDSEFQFKVPAGVDVEVR